MEFLTAQAVIDASIIKTALEYYKKDEAGQLVIAPADSVKVNHVVSLADL